MVLEDIKDFKCYNCGNDICFLLANQYKIRNNCFGFNKNVVKCKECKLIQLFPMWNDEELDFIYYNYSKKKPFLTYKKKDNESRYEELCNLLKSKNDFILEIGCGDGSELKKFKDNEYNNIIGIDKDKSICDEKNIFYCDFFDLKTNQQFDLIYAKNVFHYISEPKRFVEKINSLLNKGGKFFLEINNYNDPLNILYSNKGFNKFKFDPYSCFYYDDKTIQYMFLNNKIEIKLYQNYGILNHLRWHFYNKPGNINNKIIILDKLYSKFLIDKFYISDRMFIIGEKSE
jgi:SAM-dependent methyltransferase